MASRFWTRLLVGTAALPRLLRRLLARRPTGVPRRILVAHHLLLGDTIMLAPLLKKLRRRYPDAAIHMLCPTAYLPLFASRPYGVQPLPYDVRSLGGHLRLLSEGGLGYDLALVPGDNRWSWIARAMGARWIVAFAGDAPAYKNWPIDEFVRFPDTPESWGDLATRLVAGAPPEPFVPGEWPAPATTFVPPPAPYCVIHLGASSPHKHWPAENWRALVNWARMAGFQVVLSAGPAERNLVEAVDPHGECDDQAGRFDLAQLWHLLAGARFLVCPDTGVAHLGRLTNTPTVALFGPGSPLVSGPGEFWRNSPFRAVTVADVPCRDQTALFEREVPWVRHCWRGVEQCDHAVCMEGIGVEAVIAAVADLTGRKTKDPARIEEKTD